MCIFMWPSSLSLERKFAEQELSLCLVATLVSDLGRKTGKVCRHRDLFLLYAQKVERQPSKSCYLSG